VHEASLYDVNSFVTLTYDQEHMPDGGTLVKKDHQDFMKRLRSRFPVRKIRYFLCGEYGSELSRPHYHALLFNLEFPDQEYWCESNGNKVYRSPELEELWPFGYSWIGTVTWESAAYVARYCMKKVNGDRAWERYCRDVDVETGECKVLEPEYVAMSRRPGIGREWYSAYKRDCRKGFVSHEGKVFPLPKYYDGIMEVENVELALDLKRRRREAAAKNAVSPKRLQTLRRVKELQTNRLKRSI
jgi:hypothetical protein